LVFFTEKAFHEKFPPIAEEFYLRFSGFFIGPSRVFSFLEWQHWHGCRHCRVTRFDVAYCSYSRRDKSVIVSYFTVFHKGNEDTLGILTEVGTHIYSVFRLTCSRRPNLHTSQASLKSQAQGTSLFTSAASNQRGCSWERGRHLGGEGICP